MARLRIGVDLGGTKIEIAALDAGGAIVARKRVDTPTGDYGKTVEAIVSLVHDVERELGSSATIGVATPGARSRLTGRMKNCNSTCLNGQPLQEDLEKGLDREVRLANDANCFALSEAVDGAGRDAEVVFGVILGTGVGGGIVVRRHLVTRANAIAGAWGPHPPPLSPPQEPPPPPGCCGRHGCIPSVL